VKKIFVVASLLALLIISWETRESIYTMLMWFSDRNAVVTVMEQIGIWGPVTLTANLLGRGMACALTSAAGAFGGAFSWQAWVVILSVFVIIGIAWQVYRSHKLKLSNQ
jgi:hypothetical protein